MTGSTERVLVIGSSGQIGTELVQRLRAIYGNDHVLASDLKAPATSDGPFEILDALNQKAIAQLVDSYNITQVYLLAAVLSATGEKNPLFAWELNMNSLLYVLELAREKKIRVYWPSSIAAFGPNTPKLDTPQHTIMEPSTVYGFSKLAGERWCEYYHLKYGVDVRSLRYPGLIGWKSAPGGGTTDYAVHIFHEALEKGHYTSFLSANTRLPMMYMPDAIDATINLMLAPSESVKIRSAYNLAGFSFTPEELAKEIKQFIPSFTIDYAPDFRQAIADSWPSSINDSEAREHWGWKPSFDLKGMTHDMLLHLKAQKGILV